MDKLYSRLLLRGHLVNFDGLILENFYFIHQNFFLLDRYLLARGFHRHASDPISHTIFTRFGRKTVRICSFLFFKIYLIVDTRTSAVRVSWAAWELHVRRYFLALPQKKYVDAKNRKSHTLHPCIVSHFPLSLVK